MLFIEDVLEFVKIPNLVDKFHSLADKTCQFLITPQKLIDQVQVQIFDRQNDKRGRQSQCTDYKEN